MNKQDKIKSLTWKYFWEQKIEEIFIVVFVSIFLSLVPYMLGKYFNFISTTNYGDLITGFNLSMIYWILGIGELILIIAVLGLVYLIFKGLYIWIINNWKKAQKRARSEIK